MQKVKYALVVTATILLAVFSFSTFVLWSKLSEARLDLQTTQVSLEVRELEIQKLNTQLGLANSSLLTEAQLRNKYASELSKMSEQFKRLQKKYRVDLASRDAMIAQLRGSVTGGNSSTDTQDGVTSYSWSDKFGRFRLTDPDIDEADNESFSYKMAFSVKGYVFKDKTGKLQVRKTDITEVIPIQHDNGTVTYEAVPDSKMQIVDSQFEYINVKDDKKLTDIFNPRGFVFFDTQLQPGVGVELLNLGNFIDWANVGLNVQASINPYDNFTKLQKSSVGIGVSYTFLRPIIDTNVALGFGVLTPADNFVNQWILTANIGFYLTN